MPTDKTDPQAGEHWRCLFDPSKQGKPYPDQHGPTCEIISVERGMVTFQWLGRYHYVKQQTVTLGNFLENFARIEGRP